MLLSLSIVVVAAVGDVMVFLLTRLLSQGVNTCMKDDGGCHSAYGTSCSQLQVVIFHLLLCYKPVGHTIVKQLLLPTGL